MSRSSTRPAGFTIVELMVVIGIIGLLMGLLLPALNGVRMRGKKTQELSLLRQVGLGWTLYANNYNDYVLPGYIEVEAQERLAVRYEFPDHGIIPPAPDFTSTSNIAGPWTWRLASYVDYNHDVFHGYRNEDQTDIFSMIAEADEIAEAPAFGYNAFYCGGWMRLYDDGHGHPVRNVMWDSRRIEDWTQKIQVVADAIARIRKPTEFITFCSVARPATKTFKKLPDNIDGSHVAVPSFLADMKMWERPAAGATTLVQYSGKLDNLPSPIPCGRYTGQAAVLRADGSCDSQTPGALADQRQWINVADTADFTHRVMSWP